MASDKHLRCSFCGKSKDAVKRFISGPSVYICNECISLCNEILAEEEEKEASSTPTPLPTPREIKDALDQYVIGLELPGWIGFIGAALAGLVFAAITAVIFAAARQANKDLNCYSG